MEGKAHVTAVTFLYPSAVGALNRAGISAAIVEEYHLTAVFKSLSYAVNQLRGEESLHVLLASEFSSVHNDYLWHTDTAVTLFQRYQSVFARYGIGVTLQSRSGTAKQCLGPVDGGQHDGGIAPVVTG